MSASAYYDAFKPTGLKDNMTPPMDLLQLPRLQHPLAVAACSLAWAAW